MILFFLCLVSNGWIPRLLSWHRIWLNRFSFSSLYLVKSSSSFIHFDWNDYAVLFHLVLTCSKFNVSRFSQNEKNQASNKASDDKYSSSKSCTSCVNGIVINCTVSKLQIWSVFLPNCYDPDMLVTVYLRLNNSSHAAVYFIVHFVDWWAVD